MAALLTRGQFALPVGVAVAKENAYLERWRNDCYVAIDRHVLSTRACARAHTEALEVPEVLLIRHKANSVRQTVRV